jgi:hypothetical protein
MSIDDVLAVKVEAKNLHAAMQWLNTQTKPPTIKQIEDAARRFNLSPRSEEVLLKYFKENSLMVD